MGKNKIKALTYLALGDSYTIGEGLPTKLSFPSLLSKGLKKSNFRIAKPRVIAQTGWTTDELIEALNQKQLDHKYDLVSLLIGVNNQYRNYPDKNYKSEFALLLERAINYAKRPNGVFVLSIPDYGCTPFVKKAAESKRIGKHIDKLNTINRSIVKKAKVSYFDITLVSRDLSTPGLLAEDALHYSGKMYQRWVDLILPKLEELISLKK